MLLRLTGLVSLLSVTAALLALSGCSCDRSGVDWHELVSDLRTDHQRELCTWQSKLLPFEDGETAQCPAGEITFDRQRRFDECNTGLDALPDECELKVYRYEDCVLPIADGIGEDPCADSEQLIGQIDECQRLIDCRNAG